MRRTLPLLLALAALAGCGSDDQPATPAACLAGGEAYVHALAAAPDSVTLDGTRIAECLPADQAPGPIATVGESMVAAATELNRRAAREPLGRSTVALGYLVGTVSARAEETGGIHADLARRVETAALAVRGDGLLPGGFQQRYEEGLAAGRESAAATG